MRDRGILEQSFEQYKIPRDFKKYPIRKGGVYGVATNDGDCVTNIKETIQDGKQKAVWYCPVYFAWKQMIKRGCSHKYKENRPTYKDVSICEEWLLFSKFRNWWIKNSVRGWQLDKDLLVKGNLIYSPETCTYVPNYLNTLLADCASTRGEYPLGIYFDKHANKFKSQVKLNRKQKHLGLFTSPQEAHKAWQVAKIDCIKDAIIHYTEDAHRLGVFDQRVVTSLEGRISILQDDVDNGGETFVLH